MTENTTNDSSGRMNVLVVVTGGPSAVSQVFGGGK